MTSAEGSAAAATKRALGAYGESLAARHLVEQGMVLLDRNWRCDAGEIDLVLRDGDVLVVCEVKTRSSLGCGTPHEAVTAAKLERLQRLARRWAEDARRAPRRDVRIDLVAVLRPRRGAVARRPRAGDRLMPFATAHTVSLQGALGHLIDVQADVSPGQVGTTLVGRPDAVAQRGPRPLPDGDHQQQAATWPATTKRITILLSPADLPKRGTHFDLAIAVAVLAAAAIVPRARSARHACSSASSPSTAACARCRACCRWCWPPRARGFDAGLRARAAGARGGDGPGHDRPRHALAGAGRGRAARRGGARGPAGGADVGQPAARRGAARSGWTRSTWPTCSAWPTPGTPSRSPRPAATT